MSGNLDILVITESKIESKIDERFPKEQFCKKEFSFMSGMISLVKNYKVIFLTTWKGFFLELNLKKSMWLLFGGYNPNKEKIAYFLSRVGPRKDHYAKIRQSHPFR